MELTYRVGLEIPAYKVYCLDLSPCGTKLAAGTVDGDIFVWDTLTGDQYYPTLTPPHIAATDTLTISNIPNIPGPSVLSWVNETSFVCGFSDGYISTCHLQESTDQASSSSSPPKYRLHILRRQATNEAIKYLSYNQEISCMAVSGTIKTRLWNKKGALDWEHWTSLKEPSSLEERKSLPLKITSSSWLSHTELITSYLHHGIVIWDVEQAAPIRSINAGGIIFGGVWCSEVEKFVAVNGLKKIDVYDLDSGQIWSPESPDNVASVKAIHRGSGFVAGRRGGQADLVDISECLILKTLHNQNGVASEVDGDSDIKILAVYQDPTEENFMIAMAYRNKCIIWRTEALGSSVNNTVTL